MQHCCSADVSRTTAQTNDSNSNTHASIVLHSGLVLGQKMDERRGNVAWNLFYFVEDMKLES
jgi:hypothetical protein